MNIYICPVCKKEFQAEGSGVFKCPLCQSEVGVKASDLPELETETGGNWFAVFYRTIKESLTNPTIFFEKVERGNGVKRPLIYAMAVGLVGFIFAIAYQAGFQFLAVGTQIIGQINSVLVPFDFVLGSISALLFLIIAIVFMPIAIGMGILINSAVLHLCLLIIGAAKKDFASTFRVVCYSFGPQVLGIVPIFGGMVSAIWVIVLNIIGVKVVHETSYGKSTFAVFLPLLFCCGLMFLFMVVVAGGVVAAIFSK